MAVNLTRTVATVSLALSLAGSGPAAPAPAQTGVTLALAPQAGTEYVRPAGLMNWADRLIAEAGMVRPAGLKVYLSNDENCGADISPVGLGGCTHYETEGPVIVVSPELGGWQGEQGTREHIVFHELGHALGIKDECLAESFANQLARAEVWSYPECQR